jgi:hypothetical protein
MSVLILMSALAFQAAKPEPITVVGRAWAPFVSPMGEPFRPDDAADDSLTKWFRQADRNGDGALSAPELSADAERFFATLDADRDGAILPPEFVAYEWEIAPEIQVNSRLRRARGEPAPKDDAERKKRARQDREARSSPDALQGAARYALLNIPQPVAASDTNFDRAVSLDEFRQAAAHRFGLLDRAGDGQLTLVELQALLPTPRALRGSRNPRKDARDNRIANPIPLDH